jgi:hypothetical protein
MVAYFDFKSCDGGNLQQQKKKGVVYKLLSKLSACRLLKQIAHMLSEMGVKMSKLF